MGGRVEVVRVVLQVGIGSAREVGDEFFVIFIFRYGPAGVRRGGMLIVIVIWHNHGVGIREGLDELFAGVPDAKWGDKAVHVRRGTMVAKAEDDRGGEPVRIPLE